MSRLIGKFSHSLQIDPLPKCLVCWKRLRPVSNSGASSLRPTLQRREGWGTRSRKDGEGQLGYRSFFAVTSPIPNAVISLRCPKSPKQIVIAIAPKACTKKLSHRTVLNPAMNPGHEMHASCGCIAQGTTQLAIQGRFDLVASSVLSARLPNTLLIVLYKTVKGIGQFSDRSILNLSSGLAHGYSGIVGPDA